MSGYPSFSPKRPAEQIVLAFDFAPDLPAGVTLSAVQTVGVELLRGSDATPAAVLNGAATLAAGTLVLQPVRDGVLDADYLIVPRVLRSDGEIREMPMLLPLRRVI